MNTNELIQKLQELVVKHGDLEVCIVVDDTTPWWDADEIDMVKYKQFVDDFGLLDLESIMLY